MSNSINNKYPDNYFSLLGLPVSFVIDKNKLTSHYHDIQKSIHPDNFANATELERRLSVQKSAQINDALQTLKNPLQRSIYLLSLYDIELGENNTSVDPAFLMEQMELRENLSQVSDKTDPLAELDIISDDVKARIKQINSDLETLFQQLLLNERQDDELLNKTSAQVLKMQFLNRLQEECLNKEDDLAEQL